MVERHAFAEDVETFLALAAADDFADAGHKEIHGGDRLAIGRVAVVFAHVEGFDRARVIVDRDRALEVFLAEETLVFGLEVVAPRDGVLPRAAGRGEDRDGFGVTAALERTLEDEVQAGEQVFVDELGEKFEIGGAVLFGVADEVFDEFFGERHVALKIAKRHLGLDHPELGGVAGSVGIFGAEGGAEGVNVGKCRGEDLGFKLAGDGEKRFLGEEVLGGVDGAVLGLGRLSEIERRDAEHVARAFGIAGGDDGRVDVAEGFFLEELVDGVGESAAHAEDGAEKIGARAEVGDFAEEFEGVAFFLERVGRIGFTENFEFLGDDFPFLALTLGGHEFAVDGDRGAGAGAGHGGVVGQGGVDDDLDAFQAGAIVQLDEGKGFGVAAGADPALEKDGVEGLGAGEGVFDERAIHGRFGTEGFRARLG